MNLTKAVVDNAPNLLDEIDKRIAVLLAELRDLQGKRTQVAMHLHIATLDAHLEVTHEER
jgi:hypothetical protein